LANESLANKTAAWLERSEIKEIAALHRILLENLANVQRAIAAQNRDLS
jgi:hypothetical protein